MRRFEGKWAFIVLTGMTIGNLIGVSVYSFIDPSPGGLDVALSILHGAFAVFTGSLAIDEYTFMKDEKLTKFKL